MDANIVSNRNGCIVTLEDNTTRNCTQRSKLILVCAPLRLRLAVDFRVLEPLFSIYTYAPFVPSSIMDVTDLNSLFLESFRF